jgi:hypothetical protein
MKTNLLAGLILAVLGTSATAGSLLDVTVLARSRGGGANGLPSYWYGGQTYVEGVAGQEFRVRLTNHTGERVLAVLSVDGVNAITGQTAGVNQIGYIVNPYQSVDVDGWRKSNVRTAAFFFTDLGNSYAARTGRPDNVGVIGAAVFREVNAYRFDAEPDYPYPPQSSANDGYPEYKRRESADAPSATAPKLAGRAPSAESAPVDKAFGSAPLGTGHGRSEYAPLRRGQFNREANVFEGVNVRYDSYANLIAMGVIPRDNHYGSQQPESFPAGGGYVPDPDQYSAPRYRLRHP